jgi:hypothetical protein
MNNFYVYVTQQDAPHRDKIINTSKEVGLEINVEKCNYKLQFCHQDLGQSHDMKIYVTDAFNVWHSSNILEQL